MTWLRKPIAMLVVAVVVLAALWWAYSAITARPKAEARLGKNTTEAALESGRDAVGTVGAQGAAEDAVDATTKENEHAIREAEGADAPVARPAHDAGLRSLCGRASYSQRPECLQFTPPR